MSQAEPPIAFLTRGESSPGAEIRVNFGVLAGREATQAELEELGKTLLDEVRRVSVVSEDRIEIGPHSEAAVHQVRVELADAPDSELERRLVGIAERWARACFDERHVDA